MTNFPMPPRSMSLDFIAFGVAAAAALVVLFVLCCSSRLECPVWSAHHMVGFDFLLPRRKAPAEP